MLEALKLHDPYTYDHSCRVSAYSVMIGHLLGLDARSCLLVQKASLLHDVGKIEVEPAILNKTSPLTEDEFGLIKMHAILGSMMLGVVPELEELTPIVLHHHERWDGRGYPTGLSGIDIPIESRIILVADAFDAMTTERPYGKTLSVSEAMDEISAFAGQQFDPLVAASLRIAFERGLLERTGASI